MALACHGLQARAMRTDCLITPSLHGPEVIEQVTWDGCSHTQPDLPPVPGCPSTFGSREHLCHNKLNFQVLQTHIQAISLPTAIRTPRRQCFSTNSPLPHLAVHCGQAHPHSHKRRAAQSTQPQTKHSGLWEGRTSHRIWDDTG